MTLTSFSSLIRKNFIPFLILCIIAVLGYLIYVRYSPQQPQETKAKLNYPNVVDFPLKVKQFNLDKFTKNEAPKELSIVVANQTQDFFEKSAEIKQKFNISSNAIRQTDPKYGEAQVFSTEKGILTLYKDFLSFQAISSGPPLFNSFSEADSKKRAAEFVTNLNLGFAPNQNTEVTYTYFEGEDYYENRSSSGASWINVVFEESAGPFPIISQTKTKISLNTNGDIMLAEISAPKNRTLKEKYPIIDVEKALLKLKSQEGFPISISGAASTHIDNPRYRNIEIGTVTGAHLAYYSSPQTREEHPVWVFNVESTINSEDINILYIVFAIDPENYKTINQST